MNWSDNELRERRDGSSSIDANTEARRAFREHCATGEVFEPKEKPMNIAELHHEIRKLLTDEYSSCVSLVVWHFAGIAGATNPEVSVRVSVLRDDICEQVNALTCEAALAMVKASILPKMGLADYSNIPAVERIAKMDCDLASIDAGGCMTDPAGTPPSPITRCVHCGKWFRGTHAVQAVCNHARDNHGIAMGVGSVRIYLPQEKRAIEVQERVPLPGDDELSDVQRRARHRREIDRMFEDYV